MTASQLTRMGEFERPLLGKIGRPLAAVSAIDTVHLIGNQGKARMLTDTFEQLCLCMDMFAGLGWGGSDVPPARACMSSHTHFYLLSGAADLASSGQH